MFRKLTESDRGAALNFLGLEPAYNVFATGDIENFGFDADFQEVWGDVDATGGLRSLALRYHNNYIVYAPDGRFDVEPICNLLRSDDREWLVSGKEAVMDRLSAELDLAGIRRHTLAALDDDARLPAPFPSTGVEWIGIDDFDQVIALRETIREFQALPGSADALRHNMETGAGRTNVVRLDGKVVASASSAAENSRTAMIIGVCTEESRRRQGFASACVADLCRTLLAEGKTVCLFYENPKAARIYKRLGFRDLGRWAMAGAPV
jgi:predicted GNAT family acetyltransferase